MAYLCPICKKPLICYWKLDRKEPVPNHVVGRALRDRGFGGYRFFETKGGQGFEYDSEKDPKKRHQHEKKEKKYQWGDEETVKLWVNYLKLNPVFSINGLIDELLTYYSPVDKGHLYISTQSQASKWITRMRKQKMFKVIEDKMKHGKSLFFIDLIAWKKMLEEAGSWRDSLDNRLDIMKTIFGAEIANDIDLGSKEE